MGWLSEISIFSGGDLSQWAKVNNMVEHLVSNSGSAKMHTREVTGNLIHRYVSVVTGPG